MRVNKIWKLVDLPEGRKAIESKWVLKIKLQADIKVKRYKVIVFLNGEQNKEIYIEQPEYFIKKDHKQMIYRLLKSIYGLKQSIRKWYLCFQNVVASNDFTMIDK